MVDVVDDFISAVLFEPFIAVSNIQSSLVTGVGALIIYCALVTY